MELPTIMQKRNIHELNMDEFHSKKDKRITDVLKSELSFKEKTKKIREIRVLISKEMKHEKNRRYKEYLDSYEWDKRRLLTLKRANNCCEGCGSKDYKLEVHHLTYERIGMELLTDLVAYCDFCHELAHENTYHKNSIHWWSYLILSTNDKPKGFSKTEMKNMPKEDRYKMLLSEV